MTHFLFPRRQSCSDREHRFAHFDPVETAKNAAGAVADFTSEWGKWTLEKGSSGYGNIKETVKYYWQMDMRSDYREHLMQNTAQFFELASPDMLRLLNEGFQKESVDSFAALEDMLNHAKWIDAFSTPGIFDDAVKPMVAFTMKNGPLGLVLSVPAAERKKMYAGYVDRFIPQDIQAKHVGVFGPDLRGPAHEDAVEASSAMLNDAMRDMLGSLDTPPADPESRKLAIETLDNRYKFTGQTLSVNGTDVQDRANLKTDFQKITGGVPRLTDIRDLQSMATPSLLKGAAKLGIIGDVDVENYMELGRLREREIEAKNGESGRQIEDLTKVTKKELAREAMSMSDVFHNMGGFEKLALIVAGFFALQSKGIRNVALAGAGYYYFSKFVMKSDKPFDPLSKGARNITSIFFGLPGVKQAREAIGLTSNMTSQEAIDRGQVVSEFLTDDAKEQIDASVTGFRLLYDMPMNELARYVELGDFSGVAHKGVLRTWDPAFQIKARRMLEERGLDKGAIDRFFNDTSRTPIAVSPVDMKKLGTASLNWNSVETGDALVTAFYLSASDDPRLAADVQFVEEARAAYGGSYDAILDAPFTDRGGRTANAKQIFFDIARAGKDAATSETLGQFMAQRMGLRNPPKSQAEALEDSKFNRKKAELEGHTHEYEVKTGPAPADKEKKKVLSKLTAVDKGNVVEVGQKDGLGIKLSVVLPKTEFIALSKAEIVDRWAKEMFAKKKAELDAKGYMGGLPLAVTLSGEMVKYDSNNPDPSIGRAETSVFTFVQQSADDIHQKYNDWFNANWVTPAVPLAPGVLPLNKDPF